MDFDFYFTLGIAVIGVYEIHYRELAFVICYIDFFCVSFDQDAYFGWSEDTGGWGEEDNWCMCIYIFMYLDRDR